MAQDRIAQIISKLEGALSPYGHTFSSNQPIPLRKERVNYRNLERFTVANRAGEVVEIVGWAALVHYLGRQEGSLRAQFSAKAGVISCLTPIGLAEVSRLKQTDPARAYAA